MHWDDKAGQLTIGTRDGTFPGMVKSHVFRVTFVSANHGVGPMESHEVDEEVTYTGQKLTVSAH